MMRKLFQATLIPGELERKIKKQRSKLYRIALSWCGSHYLADDLTQETLVRAINKQDQIRDHAALEGWLFRILNNCWLEHLRRERPTEDVENVLVYADDTVESLFRRQQIVERVRHAIAALPMGQRQVVTLVDIQGFSYAEVGTILDIPKGTVMSRLSRARAALKQRLLEAEDRADLQRRHIRRVK